jgi:UDP-N-acetylglucosamine 1-carboxyvinyltransferase
VFDECIKVLQSSALQGEVSVSGAKNSVLVSMAATLLAEGESVLTNVPISSDVRAMASLLSSLGAEVCIDEKNKVVSIDTKMVCRYTIGHEIMKKMRASVLVMGPMLARFSQINLVFPGGCSIGARPIDYHLKNFKKMGVDIQCHGDDLCAQTTRLVAGRIALEYPSVGATENLLMAAVLTPGTTTLVNVALEPEVLALVDALQQMGARINVVAPATLEIVGVLSLQPMRTEIIPDRLEAGSLLLAGAVTGGDVSVHNARAHDMDVFLMKLQEMGHVIEVGAHGIGVRIRATRTPQAVSFKTGPYPGFPTDLQSPMMVAQCVASGVSDIHETVFENRFLHVPELQKMGAQIQHISADKVRVHGVGSLRGVHVNATDIRASCALVLAGLAAQGETVINGVHHWRRGYENLEQKLTHLGSYVTVQSTDHHVAPVRNVEQCT